MCREPLIRVCNHFPENKAERIHNPLICSRFFARVAALALSQIHRRCRSAWGSRSSRFEVLISIDLRLQAAPLIRASTIANRPPTPAPPRSPRLVQSSSLFSYRSSTFRQKPFCQRRDKSTRELSSFSTILIDVLYS